MIHESICTYEVAKLARKKGFNDKCYHYYQKRESFKQTNVKFLDR